MVINGYGWLYMCSVWLYMVIGGYWWLYMVIGGYTWGGYTWL